MGSLSAGACCPAANPMRRGRRVAAALLLAAGLMPSVGYTAPRPSHSAASLCMISEETVFSCPIGKKIASVCGHDASAVYRFGKPGHVELEARGLSFAERTFSGGGESQISFDNKGYRYIVFDSLVRTSFGADGQHDAQAKTGLIIQRSDKTVSNVKCGGSAEAAIGSSAAKYMPTGVFVVHQGH